MKRILILTTMMVLLCGCGALESKDENLKDKKMISCSEMKELLDSDDTAMLIDVRTKEEYEEGHLDNAINIEYRELSKTLEEMGKNYTSTPIIVYCKTGNRSDLSYNELVNSGYSNVYDLGAMSNCK